MRYTVPTNWQPDLVPALAGLPVDELYGQLPRDFVGGGRASALIGEVSRRQVRRHVTAARKAGLHFNYTLNATTLGNREWSLRGQRQLAALIDFLVDSGVDRVTVSLPYLLEYIKHRTRALEVMVSTQTLVASPERARRWEALGADGITLSVLDVQRDFAALRRIRAAVGLRLQLIANLLCLQGCPASGHHAAINAHASQRGGSRFAVDYCTLECTRQRLAHPDEIIRAGWIRPEDVHHYEQIGIDRLKLTTRGMTTEALVAILSAYAARRSPADLMELFPGPEKSLVFANPRPWHMLRHYLHPHKVNLVRLARMRGLTARRALSIDAAALGEDFLAPFLEGRCDPADCDGCRYCHDVAARAVRIGEQEQAVADHDRALEAIRSGALFRWLG
ncbi:MAG: U32 family peptidase [Pseudomonadota bacterium]